MQIAEVPDVGYPDAGYEIDVQAVPVSATTAQPEEDSMIAATTMTKEVGPLGGLIGLWLILALLAVIIVATVLKGIALWRAGQKGQKGWFVALFLINTAGILEAIYLLTAGKRDTAGKK
jgi:hypothetical protein